MVELIVPNASRNSLIPTSSTDPASPRPIPPSEEDYVPMYTAREASGERTVQFAQ